MSTLILNQLLVYVNQKSCHPLGMPFNFSFLCTRLIMSMLVQVKHNLQHRFLPPPHFHIHDLQHQSLKMPCKRQTREISAKYEEAVALYSKAIGEGYLYFTVLIQLTNSELNRSEPSYLMKRAISYIGLNCFRPALEDCELAFWNQRHRPQEQSGFSPVANSLWAYPTLHYHPSTRH